MKRSRTGVPRLPARSRSRPRTLARPKLNRRLPPTLAVRTGATVREDQPPPATPPHPSLPLPATTPPPALPPSPPPPPSPQPPAPAVVAAREVPNAIAMRGDVWEVRFRGHTLMLEGSRGLRYIALLIRDARHGTGPLHAKELVALADGRKVAGIELERSDEILDAAAKKQLLARLEEVAAERDRATAVDDLARAATLDDEHERIVATLSRAAAPGSRRRKAAFDDAAEKARKAVAKAISETIARIRACPGGADLADHLGAAIRKGQWLSYADSAAWQVDLPSPLPRK